MVFHFKTYFCSRRVEFEIGFEFGFTKSPKVEALDHDTIDPNT